MATASSIIAASVLSPQASAATQYSLLSASSISAQPAFAATSVYIAALALLDSSGFTKKIYDSAIVSEAVEYLLAKNLYDSVTPTQTALALHARKPFYDSVSLSEAFEATLVFLRDFADSISVDSSPAFLLSRPLSDSVSAQQTLVARGFSKNLSDAFSLNDHFDAGDGSTYSFSKAINNVALLSDDQTFSVSKGLLDDAISLAEAYALGVTKPFADSVATAEAVDLLVGKQFSDSISLAQALALATSKVLADTVSLPDAAYYNMAKQLSDTQAVADQGSLVSQGYCDITYFEADYVGEYREFT